MPKLRGSRSSPSDVTPAQVAELVDALASGASGGNSVEVRVLSWAPIVNEGRPQGGFCLFRVCLTPGKVRISRTVHPERVAQRSLRASAQPGPSTSTLR